MTSPFFSIETACLSNMFSFSTPVVNSSSMRGIQVFFIDVVASNHTTESVGAFHYHVSGGVWLKSIAHTCFIIIPVLNERLS